jgi:cell division protein FtsI/penicillin-binding protein 2
MFLLAIFAGAFFLASLRLFYLQVVKFDYYRSRSVDQRTRIIVLAAERGDILDRTGEVLATSIDTYSIFVTPKAIKDKGLVSEVLSRLIKVSKYRILNCLYSGKPFVWVERKIPKSMGEAVKAARIPGVGVFLERERIYPNGRLASQILGFVGLDNQGLSGVELGFDKYLKGEERKLITESDPSGRELVAAAPRQIEAPVEGLKITLTIDQVIQYFAEKELEAAVKKHGAKAGTIVVMDIKSGELLAIASKPDFDPNDHNKYPSRNWQNRAVTDIYEPGSTFKLITVSAAENEGLLSDTEKIECPAVIKIGGTTIRNSHELKPNEKDCTVFDILAHSINTGTSRIAMRLGKEKFYNYLRSFGFGDRTNIGIPGEPRGMLRDVADWSKPDIAVMSFGQGIAVTPIQLINAITTIANGGIRIRPILVNKIESIDGSYVKNFHSEEIGRVISERTSQKMKDMMEYVVTDGTGKRAKIAGFRVGGKTGTAEKTRPDARGYWPGHYISSFIGVAPLSDPRIACLVEIGRAHV